MSRVEKINSDLRGMREGVKNAQDRAAAAAAKSKEITARAAASGFAGIATRLAQLTQKIEQVQAMTAHAGTNVEAAATSAAGVSSTGAPEQTLAGLTPAGQHLDSGIKVIGGTVATVDQANQLAAAVLQGGQPGPMLAVLDGIKQALAPAAVRGNSVAQEMRVAIAEARRLGDLGN